MSQATLTVEERPELGAGLRSYEIDCAHGITSALHIPGSGDLDQTQWSLALLITHELRERCGCVGELYARYGAPVYARLGQPLPSLRELGRQFDQAAAALGVA